MDVAYDFSNLTKITGRVIDKQTGNPIKGVIIGIVRRDKDGWEESYSNENGQYSMLDMEPGTYELMIFGTDENNKEIKISKTVTLSKDIPLHIDFLLDPSLRYEKKGN